MIYNYHFGVDSECRSPNILFWTWLFNFFEVVAFLVVIAIQIGHTVLKIVPFDEMGSYATSFFISLLAGISSLINLCTDGIGNCDDHFGYSLIEVIIIFC